jgi:hypothetical protein
MRWVGNIARIKITVNSYKTVVVHTLLQTLHNVSEKFIFRFKLKASSNLQSAYNFNVTFMEV